MTTIYLDNASTTPIRPEVVEVMINSLQTNYGNPSSTHSAGRQSKSAIEMARKSIAKNLNCTAQEVIFTSSATEGNNLILRSALTYGGVKRIITSKIEHHAVLNTLEALQKEFQVDVEFVRLKPSGEIDLNSLIELLNDDKPTLVSLMHVNNEIGTLLNIEYVAKIVNQYGALFHSDAVQSVGKYAIDLAKIDVDYLTASAHKFHGPKGAGFIFVRKGRTIKSMVFGGEQEKGVRPGTESTHNIVGMAAALQYSLTNLQRESAYVADMKDYTITQLCANFTDVKINGSMENSSYAIINVCLPIPTEQSAMLLFNLDLKGIAVSRGSACQSGSQKPSHVLKEILPEADFKKASIRISLSYQNTKAEIDTLISALLQI